MGPGGNFAVRRQIPLLAMMVLISSSLIPTMASPRFLETSASTWGLS